MNPVYRWVRLFAIMWKTHKTEESIVVYFDAKYVEP